MVEQLLHSGNAVKIIVRPTSSLPVHWKQHRGLTIIERNISEIPMDDMAHYIKDCHAVTSCLGHNLSLKGIYGQPKKLVMDTVKLLYEGISKNPSARPVKFVLMNTAGNRNRDLSEPFPIGEKLATGLIRSLLPPHADNEMAADYLRVRVGQNNPQLEWVVVRPDSLLDHDSVSEYSLHSSPTRSAIFNPGKTSRINVADFMSRLITEDQLWQTWKGQMPVIYNYALRKDQLLKN